MREQQKYELDPVFVHSRREALVILFVFLLFGVYTISVCSVLGQSPENQDLSQVKTVFGIPSWVFYGILLPWIAANVVTGWYCFSFMENDPLETDCESEEPCSAPHNDPVRHSNVDRASARGSDSNEESKDGSADVF